MRIIIDRIEGEYAVCELEDGTMTDIPLTSLPAESKAGSVLFFADGEYRIDIDARKERAAKIAALQNSIFDE